MSNDGPMIAPPYRVALVDAIDPKRNLEVRTRATRDRTLIEAWARQRGAEPATGQESPSGSATSLSVNDGDAGIRFNFPGHGRYRPISWEEWFDHFDRYDLAFVFEEDEQGQPTSYRWRLMSTTDLRASASIV
jgi:hypothetical protein